MARREYKIHPDYRNSRPVNYNRWSKHKEVNDLVAEIMSNFPASRELSGYTANMMVLVLDLFESLYYDPEQRLSYYRRPAHYDFKLKKGENNRYILNPHISFTNFMGVVDHLFKYKYIKNNKGGYYRDDNGKYITSYLSRMRPTVKFADICTRYGITIGMVGKFREEEIIILKYAKRFKDDIPEKVDYDEEPFITKKRNIIRAYNSLLDNTYLDIDVECLSDDDKTDLVRGLQDYDVETKPEIIVKISCSNVIRVFNNNNWEHGGRLYRAFWVGCPSILRKYIAINGNPTVELDYSGIHIQLLYALKGVNYAALKDDAYSLVDDDPDRELNKLILLTAINANSDEDAASSVFDKLRKTKKLYDYQIRSHKPLLMILGALKEKHALIAEDITETKGVELQYYDSLVIEQLIDYFTKLKIPILTIHDSLICESHNANMVKEKMLELYASTVNKQINKHIIKFAKNRKLVKLPHIKYQRAYTKVPNWHMYFSGIKRFNKPEKLIHNDLANNINISRGCINYFLREDTNIKIKHDTRPNVCRLNCKTNTRLLEYKNNNNIPYKRTIKLKLNTLEGICCLGMNS